MWYIAQKSNFNLKLITFKVNLLKVNVMMKKKGHEIHIMIVITRVKLLILFYRT